MQELVNNDTAVVKDGEQLPFENKRKFKRLVQTALRTK